jgi:MoaA/NifB/PqqE/SkfB family radical SAM enzyme
MPGSYLVLELTNRCSLACVHCSVSEAGHPHHTSTGYLDVSLAESLFADLSASGGRFDTLILFWLGEPLIHPHFGRIWRSAMRAAVRHGVFSRIEVHTNGTHLTTARIAGALNAAAIEQNWHFSLDAISRDTYNRIKGRDRFELVQENIEAFFTARARRGASWPRPVLQFIVGSNNMHEVGRFREHWEAVCRRTGTPVVVAAGHVPRGDDAVIFFRQLDCSTAQLQERENAVFRTVMAEQGISLPPAAKKGQTVRAENLAPCSGFWKSPVIGWQGDVTACTRDNHLDNRLGSIAEQPFSELWWGDAMRERRSAVAGGNYDGLPLCATCFIPRSLNHTELSSADIDRQARWAQEKAAS